MASDETEEVPKTAGKPMFLAPGASEWKSLDAAEKGSVDDEEFAKSVLAAKTAKEELK